MHFELATTLVAVKQGIFVIFNSSNAAIACARVRVLPSRKFVGKFASGHKITLEQQSPLDSTKVDVRLGSGSLVSSVSIRKFPVPQVRTVSAFFYLLSLDLLVTLG